MDQVKTNEYTKTSLLGKAIFLAGGFVFFAVGLVIFLAFYRLTELRCSKAHDVCAIVSITPRGETRVSFPLSSVTGADVVAYKGSAGSSPSTAKHISLHTKDGDRHLTHYDTDVGKKKMEENVKEINNFIAGKTPGTTLFIRQDDRIIALASLPFFAIFIMVVLLLWRLIKRESKYTITEMLMRGGPEMGS